MTALPNTRPRHENDHYITPAWATRALIQSGWLLGRPGDPRWGRRPVIWEPAVGTGAMAHVLAESGFAVIGSDLAAYEWPNGLDGQPYFDLADFLEMEAAPAARGHRQLKCHVRDRKAGGMVLKAVPNLPAQISAIVTNPPWSDARAFAHHALKLMAPVRGRVCLLLRMDFESAAESRSLIAEHPAYAGRIILGRRVSWFPGSEHKYSHPVCWYIWDFDLPEGTPQLTLYPEGEPLYDGDER
ncbi:MAG: hypothetical protein Alpg2KO_00160 [Alphaproteobacteria bacterium]